MTGLAQVLAIEEALGITAGHDATLAFVEGAISRSLDHRRPAHLEHVAVAVRTEEPVDYDPYDAATHADPFPPSGGCGTRRRSTSASAATCGRCRGTPTWRRRW